MPPKTEKTVNIVETRLNKPQWAAFNMIKPKTVTALVFGRGTGKSYLQRYLWYTYIAQAMSERRAFKVALVCPTFKQAVDVYGALVLDEIYGKFRFMDGRVDKTRWRITFPWGSWIQFFGAENADSMRGIRADMISMDEADDIDPGVYEAVIQPIISHVESKQIMVMTGTPRRGRFGLLYKYFERGMALDEDGNKLDDNVFALRATYLDAPGEVSQEYVERLRKTMVPEVFAREWLANFDSADGLVYPWREDIHIARPDKEQVYSDILIGVDFGYEDPGVFLTCGIVGSGRDAKVHVLEELVEQHQTQGWWIDKAKALRKKYPDARWYADPSQPAFIEALKRESGVSIRPADNKRDEGVYAVADRMVERTRADGVRYTQFFVSPSCKTTIREMATYRRKRDRRDPDRVLEAIQDGNDHTMDALRYAVFSYFGKPPAVRIERGGEESTW